MQYPKKVIVSAKAIIQYQGKILLIRETAHHGDVWDLPGGKIEYGELPEQTVVREVREELGLSIKPSKLLGVWHFFTTQHKFQIVCITYLCNVVGEPIIDLTHNPAQGESIEEYLWLTVDSTLTDPQYQLAESLQKLFQELTRSAALSTS